METGTIEIKGGVVISEDEFVFRSSRSSGPGGQHVNKVSTRMTVYFDVSGCESLSGQQKRRILNRLKTRCDKFGIVRVTSQRHRSQIANRRAALERLVELLSKALERKRVRRKTAVPRRSREKRLGDKKKRGDLKRLRGRVAGNED